MNIDTKQIFTMILVMLSYSSCKKCCDPGNPDCKNYDPFYGKNKPTANFTIRQSILPYGWAEIPENIAEFADTVVASQSGVLFSAIEENATRYEWTIGDDQRKFTTRTIALKFNDFLNDSDNIGKKIPIKLKVIKTPQSPYNQNDTEYTSERFLVFKAEFLWNGTFEGYFQHEPNVKREITIQSEGIEHWFPPGTFASSPKDSFKLDAYIFRGLIPKPIIYVSNDFVIQRKCKTNFYSYKQWKWIINDYEKIASLDVDGLSGGLMNFHAYAEFSLDGRYSITVKYNFRKSRDSKEETFIFKGNKKL